RVYVLRLGPDLPVQRIGIDASGKRYSVGYASRERAAGVIRRPLLLLQDSSAQATHALKPSVVVGGFAQEKFAHVRMGQDETPLVAHRLDDGIGDRLATHRARRQKVALAPLPQH